MQQQAEHDRGWDQWPGRTPPDDRVRGRLRSLFGPTDDTDAIAELITMRGKELEERSARLRIAVGELEQREARARGLHTRVEQILRDGAAELDLRQTELRRSGVGARPARGSARRDGGDHRRAASRARARSSFGAQPSSGARTHSACAKRSSRVVPESSPTSRGAWTSSAPHSVGSRPGLRATTSTSRFSQATGTGSSPSPGPCPIRGHRSRSATSGFAASGSRCRRFRATIAAVRFSSSSGPRLPSPTPA